MTVQNHIHLYLQTDSNSEANKYKVKMGTVDDTPTVPLVVDRALDGTLHVGSVLSVNTGLPIVIDDNNFAISMASRPEILLLDSMSARACYYIPLDHSDDGDTAGHIASRRKVVFRVKQGSRTHLDPFQQYWTAGLEIFDAESH